MKRRLSIKIMSLVLALLMVCSQLCMNVFAQEDEKAYLSNIGGTAKLNTDAYIYISDDPTAGLNYENMLSQEKVAEYSDKVFAIVDCYSGNGGYWYKLNAMDGETLPTELAEKPWIYQNDIPTGVYEDALIVSSPNASIQLEEPYNTGIYSALISSTGKLNFERWTYLSVSDDPTIDLNDALELQATDLPEWNLQLVVEAVHWQEDTNALWLKVAAAEGYTLPSKLQRYPWVYQNDTSWYSEEDWQDVSPDSMLLTLPNNGRIDLTTGVAVSDLPEGATLEVEVPTIGGETLPNVFDIKIYDADGNEWQPIDHNTTVTITLPTNPDSVVADVYHCIDYAPALHQKVEYIPVDINDPDVVSILATALQVSNVESCVAVEIFCDLPVINGVVTFTTSSFSIYELNDDKVFIPTENQEEKVDFDNNNLGSSTDEETIVGEIFYATPNTNFMFQTTQVAVNESHYETYFTVKKGNEYVTLSNEQGGKKGFLRGSEVTVQVTIDPNTPAGTELVILFRTDGTLGIGGKSIPRKIVIVRQVEIKFDANLPEGVEFDKIPENKVHDGTNDNRVVTDGNLAKFKISAEKPVVSNNDRYTFLKWNTSPDGTGTSYAPGAEFTPTRDTTLYAIWDSQNYYLDYDLNGGSGNVPAEPTLIHKGDPITLPVSEPTKANCTFLGWSVTDDGYSKLYQAGDTYTVNSDVTMHAIWGVELQITVPTTGVLLTLQQDGELTGTSLDNQVYEGTETKIFTEISNPNGTKTYKATLIEGYLKKAIFIFQTTTSSQKVSAGSTNDTISIVKLSDQKLQMNVGAEGITQSTALTFEVVAKPTYYVSFNTNGGTVINPIPVVEDYAFTSEMLPDDPTKLGYDFGGWVDANGNEFKKIDKVTKNVTFYAVWSEVNYEITYDPNEGSWSDTDSDMKHDSYTIEDTKDFPIPIRTGYTFLGWQVDSVDAGNWTSGNIFNGKFSGMYGDVKLTAQWKINQYTITFNTNGGTAVAPITQDFGSTVTRPADPTKLGYTFASWNEFPETMPAENITIDAKWEINRYTIVFDTNGGASDQSDPLEYTIKNSITLMSPDAKDGYVFVGWKVTRATGNWEINKQYDADQIDINAGMYGDVMLTAQWTVSVSASIDHGTIEVVWNGISLEGDDGEWQRDNVPLGTAAGATITFTPEEGYCIAEININGQKPSNAELSDGKYIYTVPDGGITGPITINVETTTSMTIFVKGAQGYSFIFSITGTDGLNMLVVVGGESSVTINELRGDIKYTVTELSGWSWKHDVDELNQDQNVLTFNATRNGKSWLGGEGLD